jgi:hypothetical protein
MLPPASESLHDAIGLGRSDDAEDGQPPGFRQRVDLGLR